METTYRKTDDNNIEITYKEIVSKEELEKRKVVILKSKTNMEAGVDNTQIQLNEINNQLTVFN